MVGGGTRRIRLADHKGRDATVLLLPITEARPCRYQNTEGRPVRRVRRIRATGDTNSDAILRRYPDPDELSYALTAGDPELDLEITGRAVGTCDRVHIDGDGQLLYAPALVEVRYGPDGIEEDRRPLSAKPSNLVGAAPPVWSGVLIPREQIIHRYAFTRAYQTAHTNALEFDFLFGIAAYLDERRSMVQIGSGRHGRGPLRIERNGPRYRGFLDGRIQGDAMRLVLYLAASELTTGEENCL